MSASMGADFPMIPHESALFSTSCKPTLLWVVSCQVTAKASASQVPWFVLCVWLQQGVLENAAWSKPIDFYVISWGVPRRPAYNLAETAQRKSQVNSMPIHCEITGAVGRAYLLSPGRRDPTDHEIL